MPPSAAPYALGNRFTATALHTPPPAQPVDAMAALQQQVSLLSANFSCRHTLLSAFTCMQFAVNCVQSGCSGACSCAARGGNRR